MPRDTGKRLKGQPPVHMQEFFNPTTPRIRTTTSATDAFKREFAPQNGLVQFTDEMIKNAGRTSSLMRQYVNDKERAQRQADYEKAKTEAERKKLEKQWAEEGKAAQLRGEDPYADGPQPEAFIEAYESEEGKASVLDYEKSLHDLYSKSGNMTLEEFTEAVNELSLSEVDGRSDAFIKSFVPKARQIETKYEQKFLEDQRKHVGNMFLSTARKRAEAELQLALDDPEKDLGQHLRGVLTELHNNAAKKELGLDRIAISDEFAEVIMFRAARDGRPDYLNFLKVQDPETGIRLIDRPEIADKALRFTELAVNAKSQQAEAATAAANKRRKQLSEDVERELVTFLETGRTPEDYRVAYEKLEQVMKLNEATPNELAKYIGRLNEMRSEVGFAPFDVEAKRREYMEAAVNANWTPEMREEARKYVTLDTYKQLNDTHIRAKKSMKDSGPSAMYQYNKYTQSAHDLAATSGASDSISISDPANARKRRQIVVDHMALAVEKHQRDGTFKDMTVDDWRKIRDEAVKEAVTLYPIESIGGAVDVTYMEPGAAQSGSNSGDGEVTENMILNRFDLLEGGED